MVSQGLNLMLGVWAQAFPIIKPWLILKKLITSLLRMTKAPLLTIDNAYALVGVKLVGEPSYEPVGERVYLYALVGECV